ncbi:hypothetical protein PRCB_17570 [Pantoea rodasii]|uniref:Uncharacterized protein n=1 Tax=Pantoea rodasii TaxID=1076549 RepID=A0A2M9W979_9GAMM|nr:hypothetical protein PRCB_17570 [Pantoea rodasii]
MQSGPALTAGQGAQFYPAQGQGFYAGTGTLHPGGLIRDTSLTRRRLKKEGPGYPFVTLCDIHELVWRFSL